MVMFEKLGRPISDHPKLVTFRATLQQQTYETCAINATIAFSLELFPTTKMKNTNTQTTQTHLARSARPTQHCLSLSLSAGRHVRYIHSVPMPPIRPTTRDSGADGAQQTVRTRENSGRRISCVRLLNAMYSVSGAREC